MDRNAHSLAVAVGERVRRRRLEGELTDEAVARALACDVIHLQAAERGDVDFTAEQIVELCTILRVKPSWFFDGLISDSQDISERER